ncbi:hypothetical protein RKD29_001180 [Streptomyces tendae]
MEDSLMVCLSQRGGQRADGFRRGVMTACGRAGAGRRPPGKSSITPKRSEEASQSSRAFTMSSWLRPMKFHPHDDLFSEGRSSEEEGPGRGIGLVHHRQSVHTTRDVTEFGRPQHGVDQADVPAVHEEAVLEGRVHGESDRRTGFDDDLGAEQRCERPDRGGAAGERAQKDPDLGPVDPREVGHVVLEVAGGVTVFSGKRDPQLDAVEDGGVRGGDL